MMDDIIDGADSCVNTRSPYAYSSQEEAALHLQHRIDVLHKEVGDPMLRVILAAAISLSTKDAGFAALLCADSIINEADRVSREEKEIAREKASS